MSEGARVIEFVPGDTDEVGEALELYIEDLVFGLDLVRVSS